MKAEVRRCNPGGEFHTQEGCWILEVANDAGDESTSISMARVQRGVTTEWHQLTGTDERYIIVSGRGRVEVAGLAPTIVVPGDVVRIPANTPQRIANVDVQDLVFFCVCTPPFSPEAYVALDDVAVRSVERQLKGQDRFEIL